MFATVLTVAKTALVASALIHGSYTVVAGDTMSEIAVSHGDSLAAVEQVNPQVANPNVIFVGEVLNLPANSVSPSALPVSTPMETPAPVAVSPAPPEDSGGGTSAPDGVSIPGMPQSLANCIWERESTSGTNPAANGNQFGIIPASGYNVAGDSVAQQEQVAGQIYAASGGGAWAADGCPGT